jgi:hypothetical protein
MRGRLRAVVAGEALKIRLRRYWPANLIGAMHQFRASFRAGIVVKAIYVFVKQHQLSVIIKRRALSSTPIQAEWSNDLLALPMRLAVSDITMKTIEEIIT